MRLANKLYPYPILWNGNDDYIGSNFDINIKHIINKRSIVFKIEVILDDELLLKLINENVLSYSIIIECGSTCFRKFYKFKNNEYAIEIDGNKLNEKVELHPFIIANQNFEYKDNPNLNKVYEGIEFNIEKYNIMALCNPREIIIEKDEDSLKSIRSIFTVIPDDENDKYITCDYSSKLIQIFIPRKQFITYKNLSHYPYLIPTIHTSLIIPTLIEVFEMLKRDENAWFEYEDKAWLRSICKALSNLGINLTEETRESINSMQYAQIVINSPIIKVFDLHEVQQSLEDE